MMVAITISTKFLPPSRIPNARPCSFSDAQLRVALIRADQKMHPVVTPQRPCNATQIPKDGKVEKTNPPAEVITRAAEMSLRGAT